MFSLISIVVEDNNMALKISKQEFLAKGIPERYYIILQKNILDNNIFFKSNGIKNVDSLCPKRNENYFYNSNSYLY